ncbi:MAG: hypothetical protein JRM99_01505, partial [Nitrososphaerota archaeon]|nr:hypothetical protein [Nitrososphaerota archaeon]
MDPKVAASVQKLAAKTREAFNTTIASLLAPDIRLIGRSLTLVEETLQLEKQVMDEILSSTGSGYTRVLVSY